MPRGQPLSEAVRSAVIAALMTGLSTMEASRRFKLPHQTISQIKAELGPETFGEVRREKRDRIGDLLVELVASNVAALKRIADTSSEPDYLRTQNAKDLAELYVRVSDTTLQLLEASSELEIVTDTDAGA